MLFSSPCISIGNIASPKRQLQHLHCDIINSCSCIFCIFVTAWNDTLRSSQCPLFNKFARIMSLQGNATSGERTQKESEDGARERPERKKQKRCDHFQRELSEERDGTRRRRQTEEDLKRNTGDGANAMRRARISGTYDTKCTGKRV